MALSPQWLDELKSRIRLSALIARTTKLQRAGKEWRACCPFHAEKSPSFYVNDEKGFYHCFGCQQHGGAIDWMMQSQGMAFMDAVKELATQAGMEVPAPDPRAARREEQRATLHDVMAAAQEWFAANLRGSSGAAARAYLEQRGIGAGAISSFGFGYAPDERQALKQALSQFDEALLIEAGLRIAVDDKEPYDRFRGRLMLPIHDARGRVIAFGGRIMQARDGVAKYLNSPDTPLFDKGRTLYNLHRAAPAARQAGRIIVVEGYMDVVALAQAGIAEAVAPMGTALTEAQIELLWRHADKPVLCLDGDAAGQRAAMRAAERALPLLRPGHSLQVARLPAGLDPDDLIRRDGKGAVERLLAAPQSLVEVLWHHEQAATPLATPEDKAGLKARLLAHVEAIADGDIKALYRRDLLDLYGAFAFPARAPRPAPERGARFAPRQPDIAPPRRPRTGDQLAQAVLAGLARHPEEIARHGEALMRLAAAEPALAPKIDLLFDCAAALDAGEALPISGSGLLQPPPDNPRFSFLGEGSDPAGAREDLAEAIAMLVERPALAAAIAAATARFATDPEGAFAEQQRLRKRKLEIDSRLGQMARQRAAEAAPGNAPPPAVHAAGSAQETD